MSKFCLNLTNIRQMKLCNSSYIFVHSCMPQCNTSKCRSSRGHVANHSSLKFCLVLLYLQLSSIQWNIIDAWISKRLTAWCLFPNHLYVFICSEVGGTSSQPVGSKWKKKISGWTISLISSMSTLFFHTGNCRNKVRKKPAPHTRCVCVAELFWVK